MSVVIDDLVGCTAVAVNLQQLRAARLEGAMCAGTAPTQTMTRVDQALRAVLDL
ncbi:hypothetical protein [Streptomyces melanogenes]|uniref:hypothetical protein n=1 Tax=Streptomyces melanogenes TaxID=67326 RepID=UPI00198CBBA7|nr:hypothetical protein [Streptomyces melanogenes]GGP95106.1 hypothetical protein GCM10010278_86120 [Streptomyces melanogenes]